MLQRRDDQSRDERRKDRAEDDRGEIPETVALMRESAGIMMIPHTPPQNASEITDGTPNGGTGVML